MAKKPTYEELEQRVKELEKEDVERIRAKETQRKLLQDLGERVKELNCLYRFSDLIEKPFISLEEVLQG